MSFNNILVTGGAGFMGSSFVKYLISNHLAKKVVTLDLLTYAGNLKNLKAVEKDPRYVFVRGDILNGPLVEELIRTHQIDAIVHFAAETHVDTSILKPALFYKTNVEGTISLLEVVRRFPHIHFHQISTDEVFGSIEEGEFFEDSPYRPNSPYAASKAAADHFVYAYAHTYDLSVTLSHSSNNFGPGQYPEKFIPLMIQNYLKGQPLPVYGTGVNIRDWVYVEDHAKAVWLILQKGKRKESYNIGGSSQIRNIDLLKKLLSYAKRHTQSDAEEKIVFTKDRPGHDFRYALNTEKIRALGWNTERSFEENLDATVKWYVNAG